MLEPAQSLLEGRWVRGGPEQRAGAMPRLKLVFFILLGLAVPALAQEDYRHGRVRYLEPGVTVQRGSETGAEEAVPNLPFVPGDRVWTDGSGRAEFQFETGALVRLDSRSKLDYAAFEEGRDDRVVLRLWSGGLYLRLRDGNAAFVIETPGGLVEIDDRGLYRVDVDSGEVRLSVYEGEARLEAGGRRVDLDAGERAYARGGEPPQGPQGFDRNEDDAFARWDDDRERREAWTASSRKYLPDELDPYAGEFESNGTWYYEGEMGYVWRPTVAAGWRPYSNGRWIWTSYGWTWAPQESWGWAPSHYGRWGFSGGLGWYWIPGRTWGPGWVSWATAGDYVGWCPLGWRDRPVAYAPGRVQGYAVPRGRAAEPNAWAFVRRGDMGARDIAVRRVDPRPEVLGEVRVAESPRLRLTRDARELREWAVPRGVRTKPPGDSMLGLAADRQTTNPSPLMAAPRRRPSSSREDASRGDRQPRPEDSAVVRDSRAPESSERPTDGRSPRGGRTEQPRAMPWLATPPGRNETPPRREPDAKSERDREVLRPLFRPFSEPRSKGGDEPQARPRDEARPRDDGRSRNEGRSREAAPSPDRGAPRSQPAPPPRAERASPPPRPESSRSGGSPGRSPEHARPRPKPDRE